jgi:hypothetical protein
VKRREKIICVKVVSYSRSSAWCSLDHLEMHSPSSQAIREYTHLTCLWFSEHILHLLFLHLTSQCFRCFIKTWDSWGDTDLVFAIVSSSSLQPCIPLQDNVTNKLFPELQVGHFTPYSFCSRKYFMTTKWNTFVP